MPQFRFHVSLCILTMYSSMCVQRKRQFQNCLKKILNVQPDIRYESQFLNKEIDNYEHSYSTLGFPSLKSPGNILFSEPRGRFLSPPTQHALY